MQKKSEDKFNVDTSLVIGYLIWFIMIDSIETQNLIILGIIRTVVYNNNSENLFRKIYLKLKCEIFCKDKSCCAFLFFQESSWQVWNHTDAYFRLGNR